MKYKLIIGLETHIELKTTQKMFCGCYAKYFGTKPNRNVCPVCLGLPGALPVPNYQAIKKTLLLALALNCQINRDSFFERKHYFYPDLAKGYQISQYQKPLGYNGYLIINGRKILINRVHLEEDTGKLVHGEQFKDNNSYVDFNRSGVPLVEIVTEPVIVSAQEASLYLKTLQLTVQYLGLSDCDMEKGSMRCEPNISLTEQVKWQKSKTLPNYKVEVKNINSFKFVKQAIEYEASRQELLLEQQKTPKQETRRYVESKRQTESMRSKEFAQDYRYFPEPDIPPLSFTKNEINQLQHTLNTLPSINKRQTELKQFGLGKELVEQLTDNKTLGDRYVELVKLAPKLDKLKLANLFVNHKLNHRHSNAQIIKQAKLLLEKKTVDSQALSQTIKIVLQNNQKAVADYQQGKQTAVQFLLGQCLRLLGRQIEIEKLKKQLIKELGLIK